MKKLSTNFCFFLAFKFLLCDSQKILNSSSFSKKFQVALDDECDIKPKLDKGQKSSSLQDTSGQKLEVSYIGSFSLGQIGNQMASLATMYCLQKLYGYRIFLAPYQAIFFKDYFESDFINSIEIQDGSFEKKKWLSPFRNYDFSNETKWALNKYGPKYINLGVYPFTTELYKNNLKDLKKIFNVKNEFLTEAKRRFSKLTCEHLEKIGNVGESSLTYISVHVRRGDFGQHLEVDYFLPMVNETYLLRAFQHYRDKFKNVLFYIVSDDMEWCKEKLRDSGQDVYFMIAPRSNTFKTNKQVAESAIDFTLLTFANHSILTHGTFGMWGALFAGGEAVLPMSHISVKEVQEMIKGQIPGWTLI